MNIFQKSQQHYTNKLPFVMYCKPDSQELFALFQKDDLLHEIDDFKESGFAFVSFDGQKKYYFPTVNAEIIHETYSNEVIVGKKHLFSEVNDAQNHFEHLVASGVEAIKNNEFKKVVLSRKEEFALATFDFVKTFKNSLNLYPSAFKYVLYHPKLGIWFGASPEQFVKTKNNELKTVALAGTQLDSEKVVWHEKEKDEQKIVSEFIKNTLKEVSDTTIISEPYTVKAGNLVHLKTDIEAVLNKEFSIKNVLEQLHPTPAVCGFPKEMAKKFIMNNEGYERSFYTGFLGEMNLFEGKNAAANDLFVNLRCMQYKNTTVSIYVGCGITYESNPENEFIETVNKSKTIKNTLYE